MLIAAKTGWFCDTDETALRTHVAAITDTSEDTAVTVTMTKLPVSEGVRARYAETYTGGGDVLPIHEAYAGALLRDEAAEMAATIAP